MPVSKVGSFGEGFVAFLEKAVKSATRDDEADIDRFMVLDRTVVVAANAAPVIVDVIQADATGSCWVRRCPQPTIRTCE